MGAVAGGATLHGGRPWPLGSSVDGEGVNFAVFSAHATAIELCLYDDTGRVETTRLTLPARSADIWHGHLSGVGAGLVYGLRAHGPWQPQQGQRFNPHKLLLDPYAREIVGRVEWSDLHRGHDSDDPLRLDPRDNGALALKARVVHDRFDWQDDAPPATPWADTVLYEVHVRGFSKLHPGVSEPLRGTYAGLASDAAVAHLQRLGITAVSLLPVQRFLDEERLVRMGLRNHWGYNTLGFFCVEPRYAAAEGGAARDEFRRMVRRLHAAGIEVILDVVYNHTAETDEFGPTLSWRGLDNASYYRLPEADRLHYENHTGCGNTLDLSHPRVLQMVIDSLRYWVQEMHVDGFRFDLATVLGRTRHGFDRQAAFFASVSQDPVLQGIKLIAEPWDIGPGGYQLGQFPAGWVEWNDRYRDTMRAFWLGGDCTRGEFARRLCASSDLFQQRGRAPSASLNYVVSHDGFTLRDLVSYDLRHNEANGENNRDGHGHNLSWNCGFEGPTDDPVVLELRARLQRALLATLLLSQGTPMLAAGDELGHTQQGNNNPYCQDNAITWIDWSRADEGLVANCAQLIALRRSLRPLADTWHVDGTGDAGLSWLQATGRPLSGADWNNPAARTIGVRIGQPERSARPLLLLVNAGDRALDFQLPPGRWKLLFDSSVSGGTPARSAVEASALQMVARCVLLLQLSED
ncbi:MAG: glycogen debranching protein GlgX [Burkholderiaceae bacterium]|nr:glycogen debranching protein GlgX [Burkholderiaceae bacterium]